MVDKILVFYGSYRSDRMGFRLADFVVAGLRSRGADADAKLVGAKAVGLPARPSQRMRSTTAMAPAARRCSQRTARFALTCLGIRTGSKEPSRSRGNERRFTGFDDKIVAMYARGMTVREIQGFLAEQYGTEVAPDFISAVTDAVMAEVGPGHPAGRHARHPRPVDREHRGCEVLAQGL